MKMFEILPIDSPSVETSILFTVCVLIVYQLISWYIRYKRWVAVYDELPGKKEKHWFFGHMHEVIQFIYYSYTIFKVKGPKTILIGWLVGWLVG